MSNTTNSLAADRPRWKGGLREFPVFLSCKIVELVMQCEKRTAQRRMAFIRKVTGKKKGRMLLVADLYIAYDLTEKMVRQLLSQ